MAVNLEKLDADLEKFREDDKRADQFTKVFLEVIDKHYNNQEYIGDLFEEGIIIKNFKEEKIRRFDFEKFNDELGRFAPRYNLFEKYENRFINVPSKEFILLSIATLNMKAHMDDIMKAAGYSVYMKKLNEFIISVGIENDIHVDEIKAKLFDYGYREESAIDKEYHNDFYDLDTAQNFYSIIERYCQPKGIKPIDVAKKAGFISVKYDALKNEYYERIFSGKSKAVFHLNSKQCLKIFHTIGLTKEQKIKFAKELVEISLLFDGEEDYIFERIEKGDTGFSDMKALKDLKADEQSKATEFISSKATSIKWHELDDYIAETFNEIRTFALFLEDVLVYEGISLPEFVAKTGIANSTMDEYLKGSTLPKIEKLAVIATLFSRMNQSIYYTLLKKAGKFEFGETFDSPLFAIVFNLIANKKEKEIVFGDLFDILDHIIAEEDYLTVNNTELIEAYQFQVQAITRFINVNCKDIDMNIDLGKLLRSFRKIGKKDYKLFEEMLPLDELGINNSEVDKIVSRLKEAYNFSDDSLLIMSLESLKEKELEV